MNQAEQPLFSTREEWLTAAIGALHGQVTKPAYVQGALNHLFNAETTRVACGMPPASRSVLGACLPAAASQAGVNEIYISPVLDDPAAVLAQLLWQMLRATHDGGRPLSQAKLIGLAFIKTGVPFADAKPLQRKLEAIQLALGPYPHDKIRRKTEKGSRQIKVECNDSDCGAVWRASRKWVDQMIACPVCLQMSLTKHC